MAVNNTSQHISLNDTDDVIQIHKIKKSRIKKEDKSENKEIQPIHLYPYQLKHKIVLDTIFEKSPFAFDFSMLGTGKTYTTSYIMMENLGNRFKNLINIAPVSVKSKWKTMERDHGVNIYKSISFCELRSVKFKQPKHGLLIRRDYMAPVKHSDGSLGERECVEYKCSKEYLDLVNDGILLVIDEIQNIKKCLDNEDIPNMENACEYCVYANAYQSVFNT